MTRVLLLALCLFALGGCTSSGVYPVYNGKAYCVGVAVGVDSLVTIIHPDGIAPHVGQIVAVRVRGFWLGAEVIEIGLRGLVRLRGIDGSLGLRKGDCGSPVLDSDGHLIALIIGGQ